MEVYLHSLQAQQEEEEQAAVAADNRRPGLRLVSNSFPPLSLQRLSLSIDRHSGGELSHLGLVCRLFGQLVSLKLHHVHRDEWRHLPQLATLQAGGENIKFLCAKSNLALTDLALSDRYILLIVI
jgi:hypothetical protein